MDGPAPSPYRGVMRRIAITSVLLPVLFSLACDRKSESSATGTQADAPANPHAHAIAGLVVDDLASNAFGNQTIERSCVEVSDAATGKDGSLVVMARLREDPACGEFDFMWIYSQLPGAAWTEAFLGSQPTCWTGVPDEIADAVAEASGIPRC